MKAFIIAALSADGYIARDPSSPSTLWTSAEDKKRLVELTKRAGVVIMGQNTWKTLGGKALKGRLNIIYSPTPLPDMPADTDITHTETTTLPPAELIASLEKRGFTEAAICGGSMIYTMFMDSGIVDSLYLTVEPVIFSNGIRLFAGKQERKLSMIDCVKTEGGTLLLEYKVEK